VNTRTHLSIGDVLSLLRQEFPDITISKIRFLESQGLVNPERSPSGYRKFYEHDVERLRWVLRQQREHFLPLKVIRDRLARSGDISTDMDDFDPNALPSEVDDFDEEVAAEFVDTPVTTIVRTIEVDIVAVGNGTRDPEDDEPHWVEESSETRTGVFATTSSPLAPRSSSVRTAQVSRREAQAKAREEEAAAQAVADADPAPPAAPPEPPARPPRATRDATPSVDPAPSATPAVTAAHVTGASLTLDELCAASGLGATEVASLEGFGLIEPMVVGGALYYDEEALTVAKLASDFARYGIEPRHLRLFRNAADRELGLIEQVITPMLRQRNPEARQRAVDAAGELSRLGQALRSAILRRALRHHLGG